MIIRCKNLSNFIMDSDGNKINRTKSCHHTDEKSPVQSVDVKHTNINQSDESKLFFSAFILFLF